MPSAAGEPDEMLEGIYQDLKPTLSDREERAFRPWHKPRKHYIRIHQWCVEVRRLIKLNGYQAGDVVRYLGFPGEDFLDVRTLQGVCEPEKICVRYLGFDSTSVFAGAEFQFNLARHEVSQLGFINEHSFVLRTRIETLANKNSLAYQRAAEYHDFDIINIDLCNSLAAPAGDPHPPYFEAIKMLCDLQIAGRTRPWLLFLATRAIRDQFDHATKWKLFDCVLRNIGESPQFAERLQQAFALNDGAIRNELSEAEHLAHSALVSLFGVSIGKWLLRMLSAAVPKIKVTLLKSYSYRVAIEEPDMLSMAFRFEPITVSAVDTSGLTKMQSPSPAATPEWQLAVDLIAAVSDIEDIDQRLLDDPALHEKMIHKCGDLLRTVHYDKEHYKSWAAEASWKPKPQTSTSHIPESPAN
ncbi:MAG: hypothetical protein WBX00_00080 [Isosphaeraceae bacterium]